MQPSEFKISNSIENYTEKTAENDRKRYVAEKRIVSKLSKLSIPNFNKHKLRTCMKIVSKFNVPIFYNLREISRQSELQSGEAGSSFYMNQLVLKLS